jgi:hypothetical protein
MGFGLCGVCHLFGSVDYGLCNSGLCGRGPWRPEDLEALEASGAWRPWRPGGLGVLEALEAWRPLKCDPQC